MLSFITVPLNRSDVTVLAVPVCEDAELHDDAELLSLIAKAKSMEAFTGEKSRKIVLYEQAGKIMRRCVFMGLGPKGKLDAETLRAFAGHAVKDAMEAKRKDLAIAVPTAESLPVEAQTAIQALAEGAFLANHVFSRYKEKPKHTALTDISLMVPPRSGRAFKALLPQVEAVCRGTVQAREWVSTPANDKIPEQLGKAFEAAAQQAGLKVRMLSQTQLKRQNFNALLAVAAGSVHAPCLVEMIYAPTKAAKTIVLVGKGVTFDTGGLNIKPSAGLETMKGDMAGAAAVAGAMTAIARLKPRHRVIGITPIVENMPSGSATRPGDIVKSYAGKTVEIGNTDAEGRLILIDAMAYAVRQHRPDIMIDLATLTGACVVALGEKMAGVFSPDDDLAAAIVSSGETTFERCWRMPLLEDYKELLKSDLADISNMPSSRYGGAITAALFLSEFAGKTRWAHIDIAGPGHAKKGSDYCAPGGTGFGVRLLCELLKRL
jgi:leucyl aminopeptidase